MRVVRVILLLIGVGLTAGGVYFLIDRPAGGGLDTFVPAAMLFLFAVLTFVVWLPMISALDHGKILRTGEPASATVVDISDTSSTVNNRPVFRFTLDVRRQDGTVHRATVKQIIDRTSLGALRPGIVVPVRVDPRNPAKVAIDSQATPGQLPATTLTAVPMPVSTPATGSSLSGISRELDAAEVVRIGQRSTAIVQSVAMTGQTFGQQWPDRAEPANRDDPMVVMTMNVAAADGTTFTAQGIYRVPTRHLTRLSPGATVPVAYLPGPNAENSTCVDWDRL